MEGEEALTSRCYLLGAGLALKVESGLGGRDLSGSWDGREIYSQGKLGHSRNGLRPTSVNVPGLVDFGLWSLEAGVARRQTHTNAEGLPRMQLEL